MSESLFNFPAALNVECCLTADGKTETYKLTSNLSPTYSTSLPRYSKADFISRSGSEKRPDFVNGIAIKSLNKHASVTGISNLPIPINAPEVIEEAALGFEKKPYTVYLADREGVAPINLARVAFTGSDSDLDGFIADKSYEEILASASYIYKGKTQTFKSAFFRTTPIAFLSYKGGLCLADIHVMKSAGIDKVVRIFRAERNSKDYMSTMPDTAFSISQSSDYYSTKTSLMYRLRHINASVKGMKSAAVVLKHDSFLQIMNSSYIPRWLERLGHRASSYSENSVDYAIAYWGSLDEALQASLVKLRELSGSDYIEFFSCTEWLPFQRWNKPANKQTYISQRWTTDHSATAALWRPT